MLFLHSHKTNFRCLYSRDTRPAYPDLEFEDCKLQLDSTSKGLLSGEQSCSDWKEYIHYGNKIFNFWRENGNANMLHVK